MTPKREDFDALVLECFRHPEDREVLERFDSDFRPFLLAILVAMYPTDPTLAEDAYQDAFVKFIGIFRGGQKPGIRYPGYFVATAKHLLIDELRQRKGLVSTDELFDIAIAPDQFSEGEARIALLQSMMKLDRRCQFLLEGYYIRSMESAEIARRLRIQVQSVGMAIKRCRDTLKNLAHSR